MSKSTGKKVSNIAMWGVLGLLMFALAGFGISGFGGSVRVVAKVGEQEVTTNAYARAIQQEQRSLQQQTGQALSLADLQSFGMDRAVLARLIAAAALDDEAARLGISVGDAEVARQIATISAFQGIDGSFDREGYTFALRSAGLNEREFERQVRSETARDILQGAVLGGIRPSSTFAEVIANWRFETREVTLVSVSTADLETGPLAPSAAELETHYSENAALFTNPEARRIKVAWATPDQLIDTIEVPDDTLREIYAQRSDDYSQPARVLAERLGFADRAAAEQALADIAAGTTSFDALVTARGLTLEDVDQGELAADALPEIIAQALFALSEPGIVGPVDTDLGPALFRVNAILSATEVPFEDVADDLRAEYASDQARRILSDAVPRIDDLLAAGATLEELEADTEMTLKTIVWRPGESDGIAGYDAFQLAASAVQEGDFPEILELSDGGIFALELLEIIPPTLPPLADITPAVTDSWVAASNATRVLERAQAIAASDADLDTQGLSLETITDLSRDSVLDGVPRALVDQIFTLSPGETTALADPGGTAFVVRIDAVRSANRTAPEVTGTVEALEQALLQGLAQDVFEAYGQAVQAEAGLTINQQAINAVHSSIGQGGL